MSYLHYLCLFAHSGIHRLLCCVFVLFVFVLRIVYPMLLISLDCSSKVEIKAGKRTTVQQSTKGSNYTWVSVADKTLQVVWKDHFINERHKKHSWLIISTLD
jgi:hypothetical protein